MPVLNVTPPERFWTSGVDERRALLADIAATGIDGLFYADHVSFRGGAGTDLAVLLAGLSQLHPTLGLYAGIFLLPLRHPVPVARTVATLSQLAPGRLTFGIGIGGEDRHESEVCGVDPATRGRRTDESLAILRPLLRGETVTFHGDFFDVDSCAVLPAPTPPVPVIVGGRSDAAVRRAAKYGDGWLASWCSPSRFASAVAQCEHLAAEAGRADVTWQHGLQLWAGLDRDPGAALGHVRNGMESFYRISFDGFARYTPAGTPQDVAGFIADYLDAGATTVNLTPCAASADEAIALSGEVRALLANR